MLLWERINGKPINFDKPIIFLHWLEYQHPQTRTFWRKNRTQFTLDIGQNSMNLLAASKNNWKWLKNCYGESGPEKRTSCDVYYLMIDKVIITKVARIVSIMFLRKIKKAILTTLEIILDQLHSIKQIFQIAQSLIRDPTTDAVTWKNICTHANLF